MKKEFDLSKQRESIDLINQRCDVEWVYPEEYVKIAKARIKPFLEQQTLSQTQSIKNKKDNN